MHEARRAFLLETASAAALAAFPRAAASQPSPAGLDAFLEAFIELHRVPGGALAIAKEGRLVYARGFGVADRQTSRKVAATDLFRIASISKSLTAVAVLQLAEAEKISLDAGVWRLLELPEPAEIRWKDVTIRQLLLHTGGWDRDSAKFDPMFELPTVAKALGLAAPVTPRDIIRYMLRRPLEFDPGSRYAYSNFGYLLLGRAIERVSGARYDAYVAKRVLAPLGIRRMRLARTASADRAATEVSYYEDKEPNSLAVAGAGPEGGRVRAARWALEPMDAHGGWLASAVDLARFACAFDVPERCPILRPESIELMFARPAGPAGEDVEGNYVGMGWFVWPRDDRPHRALTNSNGLMPGTSSYLMRRYDRLNWAVLFNTGYASNGRPVMLEFRDASASVLRAVTPWPATDRFAELL